jgi:prepilin-type N-terminal cleavage/methylation domain-containing protein
MRAKHSAGIAAQRVNTPCSPGSRRRGGFTLLEVVLALAIGLVVLVGLYFALNVSLAKMELGRAIVQQSQVARGVINRIHNDISHSLGPISSYTRTALTNWQNNGGATTSGTSGATASATTSGTSGSTSGSGSTNSSSSSTASSGGAGGLGPVSFNLMVQGDDSTLVVYVTRLPHDATGGQGSNDPSVIQAPDLRRIAYWVDSDQGLARQEIKAVTATDQLAAMPPNVNDPSTYKIIAPEVTSISFSYFDGSNWQASWDGTQLSMDGTSPQGPPVAIAITITVARGETTGDNSTTQTFRHVVAIQTANNLNPEALQNAANNASSGLGSTNTGQ